MGSFGYTSCPLRDRVDPRALRFGAGATASVLAVVLVIGDLTRPVALGLLASQVAVFAFAAFVSLHWSVWAQIFARVIWPRIDAPAELLAARPARFAHAVGFVLTAGALLGFLVDVDAVGYGLTAVTVAVGVVHASTGVCLACAVYVLARRPQQG